jgi:uncharacterized protein (TIGR00269 family)
MGLARPVPSCSLCPAPAVHWQRYSGEHLCAAHVVRSVERRVTKEFAKAPLARGSTVVCAVSGGKDSIAALRLAHRYLSPAGIAIQAVTIDEGIAGYRPEGIAVAERACAALGVEHRVLRYAQEFGAAMDEVAPRTEGGAPCSPCGVFRRTLLNRAAREAGADALVTGHNLDDLAQSVLMNVLRGDVQRLARLGSHGAPEGAREGLVPRLFPLRAVPEREVALYAHLQGWEVHNQECPYAKLAHRGAVRDVLLKLEDETPGTRQGLLATLDKVGPALQGSAAMTASLGACQACGEPTSGQRCQACAMVARYVSPG